MMVRQYQGLIRTGMFDGPDAKYRDLGVSDTNTDGSKRLALQAAEEGIVMLKNDGTLPFDLSTNGVSSLAMIGFWANRADKMLGGYSGDPPLQHDPVTAAKTMGITVNYVDGPLDQDTHDTDEAVSAAEKSDAILFFGGIDNTIEKESADRTSISWPIAQ
jgi:beta-D-xylosidase 4